MTKRPVDDIAYISFDKAREDFETAKTVLKTMDAKLRATSSLRKKLLLWQLKKKAVECRIRFKAYKRTKTKSED